LGLFLPAPGFNANNDQLSIFLGTLGIPFPTVVRTPREAVRDHTGTPWLRSALVQFHRIHDSGKMLGSVHCAALRAFSFCHAASLLVLAPLTLGFSLMTRHSGVADSRIDLGLSDAKATGKRGAQAGNDSPEFRSIAMRQPPQMLFRDLLRTGDPSKRTPAWAVDGRRNICRYNDAMRQSNMLDISSGARYFISRATAAFQVHNPHTDKLGISPGTTLFYLIYQRRLKRS
jgi:hypothetical protein